MAAGASVEPPVPSSIWSLSIAEEGSKSSLVKIFDGDRSLWILGFNAGIYARLDTDRTRVGFFGPDFSLGQMPDIVDTGPVQLHKGGAVFNGDLYFIGSMWYRAPDNEGNEEIVQRPVLLRAGPGSTRPEFLRCISLQRGVAPPKNDQFLFGYPNELFASSAGVFVTVGPVNPSGPGAITHYPHVLKLWPPP